MPFPVDDGRIAAAEEALGRRLPDALRGRLRQENGGNDPRWWEPRTGRLEPAATDWSQASADAVADE